MRIKEYIMKSSNIERVNHDLVVLRHFIDLSSKLLPFLNEISSRANPLSVDLADREKIIEVYSNYEFDELTSKKLMDSNILSLIKLTFKKIMLNQPAEKTLEAFDIEFIRLRKNWLKIDAN
jgi:hypothetical protein